MKTNKQRRQRQKAIKDTIGSNILIDKVQTLQSHLKSNYNIDVSVSTLRNDLSALQIVKVGDKYQPKYLDDYATSKQTLRTVGFDIVCLSPQIAIATYKMNEETTSDRRITLPMILQALERVLEESSIPYQEYALQPTFDHKIIIFAKDLSEKFHPVCYKIHIDEIRYHKRPNLLE